MSFGKGRGEEVSASCCSKNRPPDVAMSADDGDDGEQPSALGVDPKDNLKLQPKRGILKTTSSFDNERKLSQSYNRGAHFDEMNVLATFHPADKDYGHMKVDEPKTPYHHHSDSESEEGTSECVRRVSLTEPLELDPKVLEERIMTIQKRHQPGGVDRVDQPDDDDDEDDEGEFESEDRIARRKAFEMKRKQHYNEFQAVKLAKQLIEEDEKDLANDNGGGAKS